ncbi:MAG: lipoate--protein ligase family protein [Nitrospinota bacterium]
MMIASKADKLTWTLIFDPPLDGKLNMEIDQAIIEIGASLLQSPLIRIYSVDRPTISIGLTQPISDLDHDYMLANDIALVRRPTGGRAIYHSSKDIIFSMAAPISSYWFLNRSYFYLLAKRAIATAITDFGLKLDPDPDDDFFKKSGSCFTSRSKLELTCNNKKFTAISQRERANVILQHGVILFSIDKDKYLKSLKFKDQKLHAMAKDSIGSIDELSDKKINRADFLARFCYHFADLNKFELKVASLKLINTIRAASKLAKIDYGI